jgi:preprotein translocase subunit YajC
MTHVALILAQPASPPTTGPKEPPPAVSMLSNPMFIIIIGLVVMFLFMSRSKKTEEKKRQNMLGQLKKGDEIQTIGGVIGKVVEAREDRVLVKVDETANTKMWFTRSAIHRVIEVEKAEAK